MSSDNKQKCRRCGRILPLTEYYVVHGKVEHVCKKCKIERQKLRKKLNKKENELDAAGINTFRITRKYKSIYTGRILQQTDIELIAEDEIFVSVMDTTDDYISSYGRHIQVQDEKCILDEGINKDGKTFYTIRKSVLRGNNWKIEDVEISAEKLVVQEFIINPDCVENTMVWHLDRDQRNCFYKNLYPVSLKQYEELNRIVAANGTVTEEEVVAVINNRKFMPDWMRNKYMVPVICGKGFLGCAGIDRSDSVYICWRNMINRVYNENTRDVYSSYGDCSICEEFWNYRNFRYWWMSHSYMLGKARMALDKDILFRDNREYNPSTCVIVPTYANNAVIAKQNDRQLPAGVTGDDGGNYYIHSGTKTQRAERFSTPEEAFAFYKEIKEEKLQKLADSLTGHVPEAVCRSLRSWKINIDDGSSG